MSIETLTGDEFVEINHRRTRRKRWPSTPMPSAPTPWSWPAWSPSTSAHEQCLDNHGPAADPAQGAPGPPGGNAGGRAGVGAGQRAVPAQRAKPPASHEPAQRLFLRPRNDAAGRGLPVPEKPGHCRAAAAAHRLAPAQWRGDAPAPISPKSACAWWPSATRSAPTRRGSGAWGPGRRTACGPSATACSRASAASSARAHRRPGRRRRWRWPPFGQRQRPALLPFPSPLLPLFLG